MLLYDSRVSGNCYKVRLLLSHLGAEYERREVDVVDRTNRLELLGELNPGLRVPTLVLDDGRPLAESNAILWYLAEGTAYYPPTRSGGEGAAVDVLRAVQPRAEHRGRQVLGRGSRRATASGRRSRSGAGRATRPSRRWSASSPTREFLVADRYTIADIALYAYTHVAGEGGFDLEPYPAIRNWLGRVASEPGHVPITA